MRALLHSITFVAGFVIAALIYHLTPLDWALEFLWLVVAGGCGGLVQALIVGGNKLRPPAWDPKDGQWDAGFLADVLIGMLGAVATLVFALALLNDKFFGTVQGQQADVPIPSWARIIAFGVLTGFASRQLLPALSKRLKDMVAEQVREQVARAEREVDNKLEVVQAQSEAVQLSSAASNPSPAMKVAAAAAAAAPAGVAVGWIPQMQHLIGQYDGTLPADKEDRVAARMDLAGAMLAVTTQHALTSAGLFTELPNHTEPSWVLPLATLIAAQPGVGDAARLLDAYDLRLGTAKVRQDSKFILHRVLLAIIALHTNRRLSAVDRSRAKGVARACREINDSSLRKRAEAVLSLLG